MQIISSSLFKKSKWEKKFSPNIKHSKVWVNCHTQDVITVLSSEFRTKRRDMGSPGLHWTLQTGPETAVALHPWIRVTNREAYLALHLLRPTPSCHVFYKVQSLHKPSRSFPRTLLMTQWRIHLPMQGTQVPSLAWEDPACLEATKPICHNYWNARTQGPVSRNYWSLCT